MSRRVPAALHHELTEYSSLLRALRTRDALDVTKHLIKGSPFVTASSTSVDGLDEVGDGAPAAVPSGQVPAGNTRSAKGKQKAVEPEPSTKSKQIKRDHWTRWPLLLEDVIKPEWTLEDEVAVIASQVLKSRASPSFPVQIASGDEEDEEFVYVNTEVDEDDPDHPFYTPYLTAIVANYLSTMLALVASHTPARPPSMQNRIEPLNWRAVLDVVVSCGVPEFANPNVVHNVIRRMEAIYGPSILPIEGNMATSYRAVERMKGKEAEAKAFAKFFESYEADYFSQASPPSHQPLSPSLSPQTNPKRKWDSGPDGAPSRKAKEGKKTTAVRSKHRVIDCEGGEDFEALKMARAGRRKPPAEEHAKENTAEASEPQEQPILAPRRSGRKKASVSYCYVPPDEDME